MKNQIKTFAIAIILVVASFTSIKSNAQNKAGKADDLGRIALNAYVSPQVEGLPSSAKRILAMEW